MATNAFVEIDIPEAKDFADLNGMDFDLELSRRYAVQIKEQLEKEPPDYTNVDLLSIAILVQYSRPFAKGVRNRLGDNATAELTEPQLKAHKHYRAWRDKHIAHSVNPFEDNQPVARYWVERFDEEGFTSISCTRSRIVGLAYADAVQIIELIDVLRSHIKNELKAESEKILQIVRLLPKNDVLEMAQSRGIQSVSQADKRRKR